MADELTLSGALKKNGAPVMPEEFDRPESLGLLTPYARAFGAGLVDPMGIPSWLAHKLSKAPEDGRMSNSEWYKRTMQDARDESPIAAGVGSSVLPALLGGGVLRGIGELTARESMEMIPYALQIGGGLGGARGVVSPPETKRRPQARYPTGGAY
jgi:hypothetical protein